MGEKVSIRSLVELIVEKSGKNLSIEHDLTQPTIKTSLYLNCALAQEELGWTPIIKLEEGVEKTIDWWRQNIDRKTLKIKG